MIEGKNEEMSTSELSGGATIHYIFQSIFVKSLEELSLDVLNQYLEKKIFTKLKRPFAVVYIHTEACKSENFSGISFLRSVYDSIPVTVKQNLETVYFVYPDLQSRLFLATFGHFIFTVGDHEVHGRGDVVNGQQEEEDSEPP
ncbi:putative Macro domain protein [Helianthus annuus]|nr:putative Macro domain protein [Helianthus annuus]